MTSKIIKATNPAGETILFDESTHTYTIADGPHKDLELSGTTTWLESFFDKFDADAIAPKCVNKEKYKGMTVQEIKDSWEANAERARNEGTNVHLYAEYVLLGKPLPKPISERCKWLFKCADNSIKQLLKFYDLVDSEKIVFSVELGMSGTIDLLMKDKKSGALVILDWKQNGQIRTNNQWQRAKPPISHMDDCDFTKYGLQLNVYQRILSDGGYYPECSQIRRGLIHLRPYGGHVNMPVPDLQKEVDDMMNHNASLGSGQKAAA